jgi:hypothetical protein
MKAKKKKKKKKKEFYSPTKGLNTTHIDNNESLKVSV